VLQCIIDRALDVGVVNDLAAAIAERLTSADLSAGVGPLTAGHSSSESHGQDVGNDDRVGESKRRNLEPMPRPSCPIQTSHSSSASLASASVGAVDMITCRACALQVGVRPQHLRMDPRVRAAEATATGRGADPLSADEAGQLPTTTEADAVRGAFSSDTGCCTSPPASTPANTRLGPSSRSAGIGAVKLATAFGTPWSNHYASSEERHSSSEEELGGQPQRWGYGSSPPTESNPFNRTLLSTAKIRP
jgi:hypothetical protein